MIFPIFIPIHDCCDNKHGSGCECPDCKESKRWENKPKEYYEERYAIPKKAYYINLMFRILSLLPIGIGLGLILYMLTTIDTYHPYFLLTPFSFPVGILIAIIGFHKLNKLVKYDFQIKGNIRLERKKLDFTGVYSWENILKQNNISNKYHITKIKENWRYV